MTAREVLLPAPHMGQRLVMQEAKRFNWLSAGRRWRKTTLLMTLAVEAALRGKRVLWGAPTYDQVRVGWEEMKYAVSGVAKFTQQRMTAEFLDTHGVVLFRSLDNPDNARGHGYDLALIDEVGYVVPEAWYEVVRPPLMDSGGDAWLAGTPRGRNWFWREHMAARSKDDSMAWQIPSAACKIVNGTLVKTENKYANPDIPWNEIVGLYETLPEDIFRQEVLAEFIEHSGTVFRNLDACLTAPETTPEDHKGHNLVLGLDWGRQNDFTAISIGCVDCMDEVAKDRFKEIDFAFQRARVKALCDEWGVSAGYAESNSIGQPNLEELQADGLPINGFVTTSASKSKLIHNLALVLEKGEWRFLPDDVWRGELEAYEQKISKVTGRSQFSAPHGMHDDTVIARALMVWNVVGRLSPEKLVDFAFPVEKEKKDESVLEYS